MTNIVELEEVSLQTEWQSMDDFDIRFDIDISLRVHKSPGGEIRTVDVCNRFISGWKWRPTKFPSQGGKKVEAGVHAGAGAGAQKKAEGTTARKAAHPASAAAMGRTQQKSGNTTGNTATSSDTMRGDSTAGVVQHRNFETSIDQSYSFPILTTASADDVSSYSMSESEAQSSSTEDHEDGVEVADVRRRRGY